MVFAEYGISSIFFSFFFRSLLRPDFMCGIAFLDLLRPIGAVGDIIMWEFELATAGVVTGAFALLVLTINCCVDFNGVRMERERGLAG